MNLENEKWPVVFKGKESILFFICTFTITNGHKSVFFFQQTKSKYAGSN